MMIKTIIFIVLELVLAYFLFGSQLLRKLMSKRRRQALMLKDYEHHLRRVLRMDGDLIGPDRRESLDALIAEVHDKRGRMNRSEIKCEELDALVADLDSRGAQLLVYRDSSWNWLRETLEVAVVALVIAFACRTLFLQPFKIPTGSMEPTLYGIHFKHVQDLEKPNPVRRFFDYLNYSRRYVDATIERSGHLSNLAAAGSIPFLPKTKVVVGGVSYEIPVKSENLDKVNDKLHSYFYDLARYSMARQKWGLALDRPEPPRFAAGEKLAEGYMLAGDHVFVNRFSLNFSELKRGDVVVFTTDGIEDDNGNALNGHYYIKRLVGLPGDTLQIRADHKLYVKPAGDDEFKLVDGSVDSAFDRIYSGRGGYHGYVPKLPGSKYLYEPYTIGADQYMMLGDNSARSQDSRFWGAVPRRNIVGRASLVWWPLSRRWGAIDAIEPEDFPTPFKGREGYTGKVE